MGNVFSHTSLSCNGMEEDSSSRFTSDVISEKIGGLSDNIATYENPLSGQSEDDCTLAVVQGTRGTILPFELKDKEVSDDFEGLSLKREPTTKCDSEFLDTSVGVTKRYIMTRISGMPSVTSYAINVSMNSNSEQKSELLKDAIFGILISCTPHHLQTLTWKKVFDLHEDGRKFKTLKKRLKSAKEAMIVLKTSENNVIGAFSSVPFKFDGKGKHMCHLRSLKKLKTKNLFFR